MPRGGHEPCVRAAVYRAYGPPSVVQVEEVDTPVAGDDQVVVKVHATTVCAVDSRSRGGKEALARLFTGVLRPRRPAIGGMEFSGVISQVGKEVSDFRVGDAVFGFPGFGGGAHAEYVLLSKMAVVGRAPVNIPLEDAGAVYFGGGTALTFLRRAKITPGERVLIYGASGAVGVFMVQLAKQMGAHVTAVAGPTNQELVRSLGADRAIDYTRDDFSREGRAYDVIVDTVGRSGYPRSLRALRRRGRYVLVNGPLVPRLRGLWATLTGAARIVGPIAFAFPRREDIAFLAASIEAGALRPVISRRYGLAEIAEAHAYSDSGRKVGSVLVVMAADEALDDQRE